jgi:hypothetical protein
LLGLRITAPIAFPLSPRYHPSLPPLAVAPKNA